MGKRMCVLWVSGVYSKVEDYLRRRELLCIAFFEALCAQMDVDKHLSERQNAQRRAKSGY